MLLAAGFSHAADLRDEVSRAEISEAEQELAAARAKGEVNSIARLTADDFIAVASSGNIVGRSEFYFNWEPEASAQGQQSKHSAPQIQVLGGGAVVIQRSSDRKTVVTDMWVRNRTNADDGTPWKLVSSQVNNLPDQTNDDIIKALVILAATATLVGISASRHVELSNRMRKLTEEFRESRAEEPRRFERLQSIRYQVAMFKRRCERSSRGHLWLYSAVVAELAIFCAGFLWPPLRISAFCIPFAFVAVGIIFHLMEHWRAFETINDETEDVLQSAETTRNRKIPWFQRLIG